MKDHDAVVPTPRVQRIDDLRQRTLPVVVWCVCAGVVVVMMASRSTGREVVGVAEPKRHEISTSSAGRLAAVGVRLYDRVAAGAVVAVLDDSELRATLQTATASVKHLRAEVEAGRVGFALDPSSGMGALTADLRRFQLDEERRRLEILAANVDVESDRFELERQRLAHDRARALYASGLIGQAQLDDARLLHEQAASLTEEHLKVLEEGRAALRQVETRRQAFERTLPEFRSHQPAMLAPLQEAVQVEVARVREIEAQRASLVLRTPVAGRVTQILASEGQAVVPGEPILVIEQDGVQNVLAWFREGEEVPTSRRVRVVDVHSGKVVDSVVTGVGPGIEPLPQRLWHDARVPEYGRGVTIAASPTLPLTPGSIVRVRFLR